MKKTVFIGIAILGGVIVLAGAAFLGARLLAGGTVSRPLGGVQVMDGGGGAFSASTSSFSMKIEPAKEIPTRPAEITGMISAVKDNSLMVGAIKEGQGVAVAIGAFGDGESLPEIPTPELGPSTEVVVTQETQIYADTTFTSINLGEMPEDAEQTIQQTVEQIAFSDLNPQVMVRVWGYQRGDRLVAEVIVTSQPVTIQRKR